MHVIQVIQKEALSEQRYFTGSMPLLTANHAFETCVAFKAFTSTTSFKICGGNTSLGAAYTQLLINFFFHMTSHV